MMTITYTAPLPVELVSFTAMPVGSSTVLLNWETNTETNNLGFNVQRRLVEGRDFVTVSGAMIPGHGTTLVPQRYTYTDNVGAPGKYEYRLEQVDLAGTIHYPTLVKVDLEKTPATKGKPEGFILFPNFPNPFNPSTVIRYGLPQKSAVRLGIFNSLGQEVAVLADEAQEAGYHELPFNAMGLSGGNYFCQMKAGNYVQTRRIVFVR
jgi:hypothetical protein